MLPNSKLLSSPPRDAFYDALSALSLLADLVDCGPAYTNELDLISRNSYARMDGWDALAYLVKHRDRVIALLEEIRDRFNYYPDYDYYPDRRLANVREEIEQQRERAKEKIENLHSSLSNVTYVHLLLQSHCEKFVVAGPSSNVENPDRFSPIWIRAIQSCIDRRQKLFYAPLLNLRDLYFKEPGELILERYLTVAEKLSKKSFYRQERYESSIARIWAEEAKPLVLELTDRLTVVSLLEHGLAMNRSVVDSVSSDGQTTTSP